MVLMHHLHMPPCFVFTRQGVTVFNYLFPLFQTSTDENLKKLKCKGKVRHSQASKHLAEKGA
jgi:hypothetical protein